MSTGTTGPPYYSGTISVTATSGTTGTPSYVTAQASASATSMISLQDAINTATQQATDIANANVSISANILKQTLTGGNTATFSDLSVTHSVTTTGATGPISCESLTTGTLTANSLTLNGEAGAVELFYGSVVGNTAAITVEGALEFDNGSGGASGTYPVNRLSGDGIITNAFTLYPAQGATGATATAKNYAYYTEASNGAYYIYGGSAENLTGVTGATAPVVPMLQFGNGAGQFVQMTVPTPNTLYTPTLQCNTFKCSSFDSDNVYYGTYYFQQYTSGVTVIPGNSSENFAFPPSDIFEVKPPPTFANAQVFATIGGYQYGSACLSQISYVGPTGPTGPGTITGTMSNVSGAPGVSKVTINYTLVKTS